MSKVDDEIAAAVTKFGEDSVQVQLVSKLVELAWETLKSVPATRLAQAMVDHPPHEDEIFIDWFSRYGLESSGLA